MKTLEISKHCEAMIFAADQAVSISDMWEVFSKLEEPDLAVEEEDVLLAIELLRKKYENDDFSFKLVHSGAGYQFLTKADYHKSISILLNQKEKRRLSASAMETLAIIAYKQPCTKLEIEQIRGVNADYTVQKLLEKELIEIAGRKESPGNPLLYKPSQIFLDYFGINSIEELPKPKDIVPDMDNTIGEQSIDEEKIG